MCERFGHHRLTLPAFAIEELFPGFEETEIHVSSLPRGPSSTPAIDQIVLAKFAALLRPAQLLEVGSFRGFTARLLAENTGPETVIHALDVDPAHGAAYRDTPLAERVRRHVGSLTATPATLAGLRFDFVFVDADHARAAVEADTRALLPMLSEGGVIFWHDYADWGWMNGANRVPEVLAALSQAIPVLSIAGTNLAVHRNGWSHRSIAGAVASWRAKVGAGQWDTPLIRG